MSPPRKTHKILTPTQRRKIIDRLGQGESMAALGREFGVTGSAIFELRKRYRTRGEAAIKGTSSPGRTPDPKLTKVHETYLRDLFADPAPPITDPALADKGNATKAQVAISQKFGLKPSAEECARVLRKLEITHRLLPSRFVDYEESDSPDFAVWRKSSAAKKLLRRETSYLRKRGKVDVPKHAGPPPRADRHWIATLRLFHIDDPLLLHSQELARILGKIAGSTPPRQNSSSS